MKILFAYGTILVLVFQASPQSRSYEPKVPVTDKSFAGAPLQATGNAAMTSEITSQGIETTAELTATLKNISSKPILAFEAVIDLSSRYVGGERIIDRHDYFFDDSPLLPGSTSDIRLSPRTIIVHWNRSGHPVTLDKVHSTRQACADVRVSFVQFSDGTKFGVSQWESNLTAQRKNLIAMMRSLLRAFDEDKESGLKTAIEREQAKPGLPIEIFSYLGQIQQKLREMGATGAAQSLKNSLANAQRRSNVFGATGD